MNERIERPQHPAPLPAPDGIVAMDWRYAVASAFVPVVLYIRLLRSAPFARDDFWWVYQRIPGYLDALAGGQFPPRTFPLAFEGAGYAFPHFYPPLGHWMAAAFAALTGSPVYGVHLSFLAAVVLASVFMFLLGRRLSGSDRIGLVAAVIYTALPYHVADVFYRGALAETWAFVWFPAIVLSALRALEAARLSWSASLGVCALLLSHTIISLYAALSCVAALVLVARHCGRIAVVRMSVAGAMGVAWTLWFLLPVYTSLEFVHAGDPIIMNATRSAVVTAAPIPGDVFFLIDVLPWFLVLLAFLFRKSTVPWQFVGWIVGIAAVYTAFAYSPAMFLSVLPRHMAYIQFPFRMFSFTGFLAATAVALLLGQHRTRHAEALIMGLALVAAIPFAAFAGSRRDLTGSFDAAGATTFTVLGEYLPASIALDEAAPNAVALKNVLSDYRIAAAVEGMLVSPIRGMGTRDVVLPLHYYPFYRAATSSGEAVSIENHNGYARIRVGSSPVHVTVVNPRSFWVGLGIGLAATLVLMVSTRRGLLPTATGRCPSTRAARPRPAPGCGS